VADDPGLHLLIITRAEALELIAAAIGSGARHELTALTEQAALEAITGPAAGTGRSFADGAAEKLVTDLRTTHVAATGEVLTDELVQPLLLQVVCDRLWRELPADVTVISARDARIYGDADTALAAYWGQLLAKIGVEHDLTARRLRALLLRKFVTTPGTRDAQYKGAALTAGIPNAVLAALADRHLLTSELRSGLRWFQLLSDRLIEPLRRAVDVASRAAGDVAGRASDVAGRAAGDVAGRASDVASRAGDVASRASRAARISRSARRAAPIGACRIPARGAARAGAGRARARRAAD
jgi:hypothetical protein